MNAFQNKLKELMDDIVTAAREDEAYQQIKNPDILKMLEARDSLHYAEQNFMVQLSYAIDSRRLKNFIGAD